MSKKINIYKILETRFRKLIRDNGLESGEIGIISRSLSSEEAIGKTLRTDYPLLRGKETLIQADFKGFPGQAFTSSPSNFRGTLGQILSMDMTDSRNLSTYIAALNAVLRYMSISEKTVHCRNNEPEECAIKLSQMINDNYGNPAIAFIGYQPAIIGCLSKKFKIRVLDLNPENIGRKKESVLIEHGIDKYKEVVHEWADIVLCTGSTITNGSLGNYTAIGKDVIFYGTSIAGAASLLNLKRWCVYSR